MALLEVDKIIINRTGISCNVCGGKLMLITKKTSKANFIKAISLGKVKAASYECEGCKKEYILI